MSRFEGHPSLGLELVGCCGSLVLANMEERVDGIYAARAPHGLITLRCQGLKYAPDIDRGRVAVQYAIVQYMMCSACVRHTLCMC